MSKFQVILLSVFGAFILIAVMLFSLSKGTSNQVSNITVWGDIALSDFNVLINNTNLASDRSLVITYQEIESTSFDTIFTEAIAEGRGPDVIIISVDRLWKNKNKLYPMPYGNINEADFKNTFIEEGELFLSADGVYALPLTVDPMVLYWNRDLFSRASLPRPPAYWDEIYSFAEKLTQKDGAGNIVKSAITLGESRNIPHAKDILSLLMLQAGTPITGFVGNELRGQLTYNFNLPVVPAEAALDFYTQFANPSKPFYSWNRSLRSAPTAFVAGDVAMYIGYASEHRELQAKNPNLNMGVALIPQSRVSGKFVTFGQMKGLAVVRASKNQTAAFGAVTKLASKEISGELANILRLPPARRDLLAVRPDDAAMSIFYSAALQSKGWLDPDKTQTSLIFTEMIDSITSGRARLQEASSKANRELDNVAK